MKRVWKSFLVGVAVAGVCVGAVACRQGAREVLPAQAGDFYENIPYDTYIEQGVQVPEQDWDICDYGASPENAVNTKAVNQAIEACHAAGGGTVLVQGGDYCTGTVNLRSNVTLQIAQDASLVASHNFDDFTGAMIMAENAENIRITGPGKICGEGEYFVDAPEKAPLFAPLEVSDIRTMRSEYRARIRFGIDGRPGAMVWIKSCKNVVVDNVILENSMCWTLNLNLCDQVAVKNLVINNNRHVANTDGIDIVGSSYVTVSHCFVSTADDGIVIKNGMENGAGAMEQVHITDCEVISCTNALKIGTETYCDITGVTIEDCKVYLTDIYPGSVSGVSIESADGSKVKDITVRNIQMDQVTCPLFIRLCNRNKYKDEEKNMAGSIENILIENVTASGAELPMIISGVKYKGKINYIKNVTLQDIHVTYRESAENVNLRGAVPEYAKVYPENWRFKDVPAYGLWVRHTDGISISAVHVIPRTANEREQFVYEDVLNITTG